MLLLLTGCHHRCWANVEARLCARSHAPALIGAAGVDRRHCWVRASAASHRVATRASRAAFLAIPVRGKGSALCFWCAGCDEWDARRIRAACPSSRGAATRRRRRARELPTVLIHTRESLPRPRDLRRCRDYREYSTVCPQRVGSSTCIDRALSTVRAQRHPHAHLGLART